MISTTTNSLERNKMNLSLLGEEVLLNWHQNSIYTPLNECKTPIISSQTLTTGKAAYLSNRANCCINQKGSFTVYLGIDWNKAFGCHFYIQKYKTGVDVCESLDVINKKICLFNKNLLNIGLFRWMLMLSVWVYLN